MRTAKKIASLLFALSLAALASSVSAAASSDPQSIASPPGRVRILDYENGSAAGLLFLEIDRALGGRFPVKPAWQSLDGLSGGDPARLARETAGGAYDLVITGDEGFVKELESRGALRERIPLFGSELILAGPRSAGGTSGAKGAAETMREIFGAGKLFFTPMNDAWTTAREARLWREAGVPEPGANTSYVESGRGGPSLLLQAEDERGYTLATEDAFAQYLTSTRAPEPLVKIAGTGERRVHFLCVIDRRVLREEHAQNAGAMAAWLKGEEAASLIAAFELGGMRPFRSGEG